MRLGPLVGQRVVSCQREGLRPSSWRGSGVKSGARKWTGGLRDVPRRRKRVLFHCVPRTSWHDASLNLPTHPLHPLLIQLPRLLQPPLNLLHYPPQFPPPLPLPSPLPRHPHHMPSPRPVLPQQHEPPQLGLQQGKHRVGQAVLRTEGRRSGEGDPDAFEDDGACLDDCAVGLGLEERVAFAAGEGGANEVEELGAVNVILRGRAGGDDICEVRCVRCCLTRLMPYVVCEDDQERISASEPRVRRLRLERHSPARLASTLSPTVTRYATVDSSSHSVGATNGLSLVDISTSSGALDSWIGPPRLRSRSGPGAAGLGRAAPHRTGSARSAWRGPARGGRSRSFAGPDREGICELCGIAAVPSDLEKNLGLLQSQRQLG